MCLLCRYNGTYLIYPKQFQLYTIMIDNVDLAWFEHHTKKGVQICLAPKMVFDPLEVPRLATLVGWDGSLWLSLMLLLSLGRDLLQSEALDYDSWVAEHQYISILPLTLVHSWHDRHDYKVNGGVINQRSHHVGSTILYDLPSGKLT